VVIPSERAVAASKSRMSLSARIGVALAAGAALGLFFGDRVAFLQGVADAYIKLLQMTVLPYVTVSIVGGLGALNAAQVRTLAVRIGAVLALLWAVAIVGVLVFPLMFPRHQDASFFSTSLLQEREPFDFIDLYIPANPFYSLANNIVPAVVVFSLVLGTSLALIPDKRRLLDVLEVAARAVSKTTNFIVALTPYGVFAIAAVVAGTLSIEELQRIEVYLVSYVGMSLLLGLWALPALVAVLTPIPYWALISRTRNALVMAFMTTSLFAVLPLLTEEAKALVREYADAGDEGTAVTDVVVPASFNFPHAGKLLSLSFVLFAGWFVDREIAVADYPKLAVAGPLVMFGNVNAAVPYLLDLFRIPQDTFRLFVASSIVNARFGTLVAAIHTLVIAVIGTCAITGAIRIDLRKLLRFAVITFLLTAAVVGASRAMLQAATNRPYTKDEMLTGRGLRRGGTPRVFTPGEPVPPLPAVPTSVLARVQQRGVIRVGYFEDSLPYAFRNQRGELVGFDVEMALQLARDLSVQLEFVPIERALLRSGVDPAVCDMVMSGAAITTDSAVHVQFSASYLDETVAFVVADRLASAYSEWSSVRAMAPLRLAVPNAPYFLRKLHDELKDAQIVPADTVDDLFKPHVPPVDAIVLTAERGSAYTLLHPEFSVAVPKPRPFKVPLGYVIAGRDAPLTGLINTWIDLKRKDGTIDELFSYWILGESGEARAPRWSIVRDVLRWSR